jgi:Holliday junction resolvase RusA-like endonuclease
MFEFKIPGDPVPQKQPAWTCECGKGRCYNPSKPDIQRIQYQIKPFAPFDPLTGPVMVTFVFYVAIPKGTSKKRREAMINLEELPTQRPDDDNLSYLITNALKGIVYDDDSRICSRHVYKFYGEEPHTYILVTPIPKGFFRGIRIEDVV